MSNPPTSKDDQDEQKSKKPAGNFSHFYLIPICFLHFLDTPFKQQRLPAWQPIITADTALPVFLIIGLLFIPIGIALVVTSERV